MIELGIRLGKPVFFVNSMISDCPQTGRYSATLATIKRLFAQCKAVALRDPDSLAFVQQEMPETVASLSLIRCFRGIPFMLKPIPSLPQRRLPFAVARERRGLGTLRFDEPYICIGGGALASHYPDLAALCYVRLVRRLRDLGYRVILTENDVPDSFLRKVAGRGKGRSRSIQDSNPSLRRGACTCDCLSRPYHPSIFASLGGTPCIFLDRMHTRWGACLES